MAACSVRIAARSFAALTARWNLTLSMRLGLLANLCKGFSSHFIVWFFFHSNQLRYRSCFLCASWRRASLYAAAMRVRGLSGGLGGGRFLGLIALGLAFAFVFFGVLGFGGCTTGGASSAVLSFCRTLS